MILPAYLENKHETSRVKADNVTEYLKRPQFSSEHEARSTLHDARCGCGPLYCKKREQAVGFQGAGFGFNSRRNAEQRALTGCELAVTGLLVASYCLSRICFPRYGWASEWLP
jgi:hypothetical protein